MGERRDGDVPHTEKGHQSAAPPVLQEPDRPSSEGLPLWVQCECELSTGSVGSVDGSGLFTLALLQNAELLDGQKI